MIKQWLSERMEQELREQQRYTSGLSRSQVGH
jgi:hypothetical protein